MLDTYMGEVLALVTAVTWALAVIFFKRSGEAVRPVGLNLFKNVLALVLFLPTFYLFGERLFLAAPLNDYLLLLASGALGIGIADTLFFKSLNLLGAGRTAIVDCLYSPFIIGLSLVWLGERLTVLQIVGAVMIISAVLAITREHAANPADRGAAIWGVALGAASMACTAVGIVMIKPLLNDAPLLWVTETRLAGGVVMLLLTLLVRRDRMAILRSIAAPQRWGFTAAGGFTGGYLAMVLWLAGMKYTQASIAAALNQTSSIFVFVFAALLLKEKITAVRFAGITLGVVGVFLVTFG